MAANNRQLTHTEKERIKALAKEDAQAEAKLTAAACALTHWEALNVTTTVKSKR